MSLAQYKFESELLAVPLQLRKVEKKNSVKMGWCAIISVIVLFGMESKNIDQSKNIFREFHWIFFFNLVLLVQCTHETVPNEAYIVADGIPDMEINLLLPLIPTPLTQNKVQRVVLYRNITVEENTDAVLKCKPNFKGERVSTTLATCSRLYTGRCIFQFSK